MHSRSNSEHVQNSSKSLEERGYPKPFEETAPPANHKENILSVDGNYKSQPDKNSSTNPGDPKLL